MLRLIIVIIVCLASCSGAKGQQFSQGYMDSVKGFFKEWTENQSSFVSMVMDNTSYIVMSGSGRAKNDSAFKVPYTYFRILSMQSYRKRQYGMESITLTESEIEFAQNILKASESFKWAKNIFPYADIVDSSQYFSEFRKAALNGTNRGKAKSGYWSLSVPAFFRNGQFAILYSLYFCGSDCGHYELTLFKNENNHWQKFVVLTWAQF
jgi:hypothetical protein